MARVGERVLAVITSRSVKDLENGDSPMPNASSKRCTHSHNVDKARAIARLLVAEGFDLLYFHPIAISFSGTPETFLRVFGFRPVRKTFMLGRNHQVDGYDVDPNDAKLLSDLPPSFKGLAGTLALARPPRLTDDPATPLREVSAADPAPWSMPDELAISAWADGTSAPRETGHGVVVAQIGTGHYRHRFFADRGYRVMPTLLGPGASEPQRDDHGFSTGEAACLFGASPDLRLRPVKGLSDPVGDLLLTIDSRPKPDLILMSWGYDVDGLDWERLEQSDPNLFHYLKILEIAIDFATASGVIVCSSMPRTWKSFPACHPDVISIASGSEAWSASAHPKPQESFQLYPNQGSPDFCCDAKQSLRAGLDFMSCTQPVQPQATLSRPELCDQASDQGLAWCSLEQAAFPLATSKLTLFLERHRGLSPTAFKAEAKKARCDLMADGIMPVPQRSVQTDNVVRNDNGQPKLAG